MTFWLGVARKIALRRHARGMIFLDFPWKRNAVRDKSGVGTRQVRQAVEVTMTWKSFVM